MRGTLTLRLGNDARPMTDPPPVGKTVMLWGDNRLCAIGRYLGDGCWDIAHQRFPSVTPTHWLVSSR